MSNENTNFIIKTSFIEIYNEEIRDLLNIKTNSKNIIIRDNANSNSVTVSGITDMVVSDVDDALKYIKIYNILVYYGQVH